MDQAEMAISAPAPSLPTGNIGKMSGVMPVSRRGLMSVGAVAALGAAVPLAAASAPVDRDARFWAAWRVHKDLTAAWEADSDNSDANWDRHSARVSAAFDTMMSIGVWSVKAVLAKYYVTKGQDIGLPSKAGGSTLTMIQWDLERIAMQELFA